MFCNFSTHTHSLIVLDELDQLDKKEILYTLFEWPTLPNSRLILIGESEGQTCTRYSHAPLPFNPLNANGVYIRPIFTSRERERRIYTPALHSGPYRAKKRSQAAPGGKSLLI